MNLDWKEVFNQKKILDSKTQGGNSESYRVELGEGSYFLKVFKPQHIQRLKREYSAITTLNSHGIPNVPQVYGIHVEHPALLMSWHEGVNPDAVDIDVSKMFIGFLDSLSKLNTKVRYFGDAVDNACNTSQITVALRNRMLNQSPNLWDSKLISIRKALEARTEIYLGTLSNLDVVLPDVFIVSPSDFGVHNLIIDSPTRYTFYDFEFFGYDRPEKLLIDTLLHPKNSWKDESIRYFTSSFIQQHTFSEDVSRVIGPYSILNWMYIVLNRIVQNQALFHENRERESFQNDSNVGLQMLTQDLIALFDRFQDRSQTTLEIVTEFALKKSYRKGVAE